MSITKQNLCQKYRKCSRGTFVSLFCFWEEFSLKTRTTSMCDETLSFYSTKPYNSSNLDLSSWSLAVKRDVWNGDLAQCQFTLDNTMIHLTKSSICLLLHTVLFSLEKVMVKTVKVHLSWGTCFCWKRMERNGWFQRYQSCKATAGNSYRTWHCA